ncbi:unnamed protein product [Auanema sp. JU1783]|nr:unnamed protein product [Auanema sp. JU1783]
MARRSRGAATTAVAPVTRATRSRTRLQAAEALAAELNASRDNCEESLDSTTASETSMVDEKSSELSREDSSCSSEIINSTPSPELNVSNEEISLDVPQKDSPPVMKTEDQKCEDEEQEQKEKLKKEVKDLLDITVNEVVKAQRLPNIDPATTSVQSNVRVRGVYHTKEFLDVEHRQSSGDSTVKKDFNEIQKSAPEKQESKSCSISPSSTSTVNHCKDISSTGSEEFSVRCKAEDSSFLKSLSQDSTELTSLTDSTAPKPFEVSSDIAAGTSERQEEDSSMGQTSMKEESPTLEDTEIPILSSTDIEPSSVSSFMDTGLAVVKIETPESTTEDINQPTSSQIKIATSFRSSTPDSSEMITIVSSSTALAPHSPEQFGSDVIVPMYNEVKLESPETESSEKKRLPQLSLDSQSIQQSTACCEMKSLEAISVSSESEQIPTISIDESFGSSHAEQDEEFCEKNETERSGSVEEEELLASSKLIKQAPDDLSAGCSHVPPAEEVLDMHLDIQEEKLTCSMKDVEKELIQTNAESGEDTANSMQSLTTNQTTTTANIDATNFYNDPNSDITGTQEMDMEVSDDSREASVEPIINVKQDPVAAPVSFSNPSASEVRPPPPPVANDVPPPPAEESYADDFYFPPPPTMPPNMDLSQFYMSLHAGDFGVEYTQQLTQYISESVHKWYQIHQYYTFNRVPLPRIDRYKAFMDHYDAFQRVQYTAVMRPNAEAQKLSEERSRNRIQGVLKSLVRDKKKKESAAEKNEELLLSADEHIEKNAEEPEKTEVEVASPVVLKSADTVVVSSINEVFKKASLPPSHSIQSPKIAQTERNHSTALSEHELLVSNSISEVKPDYTVDPSELLGVPSVPASQTKMKQDRSRSRSPRRKKSYSRSRSRLDPDLAVEVMEDLVAGATPGVEHLIVEAVQEVDDVEEAEAEVALPEDIVAEVLADTGRRVLEGGTEVIDLFAITGVGGYGGFNDRYKKRNYSRSPVREPHLPNEDTNPVEKVVEKMEESMMPEVEEQIDEVVVEEPPFPKFEEIETLIYMDEKVSKNGKKRRLETDLDCDCRKNNLDCSDNRCINREMMFECSSKCGPQCKNRRFALRQYANVKPFYTGPNKGWGVRALEVIPKGTFITEYIGEVVTNEEFASRQKKYAKDPNHTHHYIFELGQKLIDATVKGNSSRFINHSCDPNAICLKWAVPKTPRDVSRIGFFAKTDIAIGDEITFDYQFCNYGRTAQSCHCGSANCKGVIGKKPDLGDFDDEEVYDEDSEEFDDVEEPEEEKEREQLRIEKEEQLEAKAIFYLNTIHSEGYYGRKQLAKNAARFVKYLANVLTTENRIRMQSLIERADSEFYQGMKRNNLFNILLQWVSTSGWERHDLDLKIGVLRMIEEKDKDNFIEKAVGWNQENFPILCELAKGILPDDIACVDTLEQVVEKVCGDDPEAEGDGNLASYTGLVFNEMTEIASRLAGDENIKKGVETTGLKVFKIPKKVREKTVESKEPVAEKIDASRDKIDQRIQFRQGFPGYNGKRDLDRGMKRRYDDRYRRDDEKSSNRDGTYRNDFKRTRRSRFDQSPVHSPLALAVNAENSGSTDSPVTSMSIDSSLSPTKAAMKNVLSSAQSSTHSSSFESYHQNMAMWQSYMSMGAYPAPYPMMTFSAQKANMSDSDKKIGYYMSMRLEQLKHFRTSYEMEIKYLDVAIKKKEAEAALAKAHQEAAAAAAAAALAREATRNEPDSVHSSQSAPPPPPEKRRSTYARALDADGTVYYYHKETRATCWELPEGEHCDENDAVPYTQTQQPDSSMKEDEEPKCQMDIAARAIEIFSSPPGGTENKVEEVPQTTGSVEILSDLSEDEKQKRIRVFKLTVEREVKPIIDSFLKGIPSADANRRLWLIKQVAKEMYKRESSKPDSDLKFNDLIRKKVHNYTKAFMHRKCSDGAKDLWKGIGDVIALKCANAWSTICEERCTENLSLKEVKELSNEDYQKLVLQKGNKRKVNSPSIATKKSRACEDDYSEKIVAPAQPRASKIISDFDCFVHNDHETIEDVVAPITAPQIPYSQESVSSIRSESNSIEYLSCQPFQQPEIILICDNREHHGNKRGKTVVEQLTKSDIRFELRSLSVGDYLWVARLIDGSELVLDWVVERKTWDDLKSSIRKGRYDEQKQRICKAPMKNRVYLIEGRGRGDVPCEQAIATTMIRDDFMIQRCESGLQTANFLAILTRKLIERSVKEELFGIKFEDLQDISKKTQVQTVQDVWTKQLTVCPGMSTTKAKTVASAFPSFSTSAAVTDLQFFRTTNYLKDAVEFSRTLKSTEQN